MYLRLYGAHPLLDTSLTAEQQHMFYKTYIDRARFTHPNYEAYDYLEYMTVPQIEEFLAPMDNKAKEERDRLRLLHPDLEEDELTIKVHKAVVDYWLEFVVPTNPSDRVAGKIKIETFMLEIWLLSQHKYSDSTDIMTRAEMDDFNVLLEHKINEERARLRLLHSDLKEDELTVKVHKAVMDYWLEFVVPTNPNDRVAMRMNIEKYIIGLWFSKEDGDKKSYEEGGIEVDGDGDAGN